MNREEMKNNFANGLVKFMNQVLDDALKGATFKGKTIINPCGDGNMLDIPALGQKIYRISGSSTPQLEVREDRFAGASKQLLDFAKGELFTDRLEAERRVEKYNNIVISILEQTPELMEDLSRVKGE